MVHTEFQAGGRGDHKTRTQINGDIGVTRKKTDLGVCKHAIGAHTRWRDAGKKWKFRTHTQDWCSEKVSGAQGERKSGGKLWKRGKNWRKLKIGKCEPASKGERRASGRKSPWDATEQLNRAPNKYYTTLLGIPAYCAVVPALGYFLYFYIFGFLLWKNVSITIDCIQ